MSQLSDKTGKGNNLIMSGNVHTLPFFSNVPEGNRWLSFINWYDYDGQYNLPMGTFPNNQQGYFSFNINMTGLDPITGAGINGQGTENIITFDSESDDNWFYFEIVTNEGDFNVGVEIDYSHIGNITDIPDDDDDVDFGFNFLPNETYKIVISWNALGLDVFIDNALVYHTDKKPDFGTIDTFGNGDYYLQGSTFLDDFIVSNISYRPLSTTQSPEVLGKKYLGNTGNGSTNVGLEQGYTSKPFGYFDEAGRFIVGMKGHVIEQNEDGKTDQEKINKKPINIDKRFIR